MSKKSINAKNKQKIMVALMCIGAIILFYVGANFLKGNELFSHKTYFYTKFKQTNGMQIGGPVFVNGYKVGKINKMNLTTYPEPSICVEVMLTENFSVPKDSYFALSGKDFFGGSTLTLHLGNASQVAKSGDTLNSTILTALTDGIDEMKEKLNNILASVDTLGTSLKVIFADDGGSQNLKEALQNIEYLTANLNSILVDNIDKVERLVTDLEKFSHTLNEASPKLAKVIDNFDKIADSLAKANLANVILNANETIENINQVVSKINRGEGDIGQLVNNDSLYRNLENVTNNLNNLIFDLKENPKRYVHFSLFGKKEKKK